MGNRKIIFGRPLEGKTYIQCGAMNVFTQLGFESFIKDLPKDCYPNYVYDFYANLSIVKPGMFVSFVRGKKIMLTRSVLNSILGIDNPSSMSICTNKGPVEIEGFSILEQLKLIRNVSDLTEYVAPTTNTVSLMARLLFKVGVANVNPRLGSRSNLLVRMLHLLLC